MNFARPSVRMQLEPGRFVELRMVLNDTTPLAWVRISLCMLTGGVAAWLSRFVQRTGDRVRLARRAYSDGGPPPVDWRLSAVACEKCVCRRAETKIRCELGQACVADRHVPRVERFFDLNPHAADAWLADPYFAVRASAARHANVFRLAALVRDPHETVRGEVALRVPQRLLRRMVRDPQPMVRLRVAERLEPRALDAMAEDPDPHVRRIVARRAEAHLCEQLQHDPAAEVRALASDRLRELRAPALTLPREP
jgi:hypothetical protein